MENHIKIKNHYPFVTRTILRLYKDGRLPFIRDIVVEEKYGHVGRIIYTDERVRVFRGSCSGLNGDGAAQVARDKGYSKYFMKSLGYSVPRGEVFLLPEYVRKIDRNLSRYGISDHAVVEKALAWIEKNTGYPCFVKPNDGTKGHYVFKRWNEDDVKKAVSEIASHGITHILIEEAIPWPDYRVCVLGDEVLCCYRRVPLFVIGDGESTIRKLLEEKRDALPFHLQHKVIDLEDPRLLEKLKREVLDFESVPAEGKEIVLRDISNLEAGGLIIDYSERIHPEWKELCLRVTKEMGLNLCGVDIACENPEEPGSPYSIIELNSAPGFENFAAAGEENLRRVEEIYTKILRSPSDPSDPYRL